ncbi:MAG: hypothetical protein CMK32_08025 [Porticoccaceae bacterium]|nr:hypothetical protein [Porticoccaceae bacterium]
MAINNCRACGRLKVQDLDVIEKFLSEGITKPPSRATKDELEKWIDEHARVFNNVRDLLVQTIAGEIHSRLTMNQIDFDSIKGDMK